MELPLMQIRVKCNEDDTIGDLKKLVAAQTGMLSLCTQLARFVLSNASLEISVIIYFQTEESKRKRLIWLSFIVKYVSSRNKTRKASDPKMVYCF